LTAERKAAAAKLAKLAEVQINSLAMKVRFEIDVQSAEVSVADAEKHAERQSEREGGKHSEQQVERQRARQSEIEEAEKQDESLSDERQSFVTGRDFSRAENAAKRTGALAPEQTAHWTAAGWDQVEYRIATNPGEPLKSLHEIASGGEMSRVMLALKVAVEETSSKARKTAPTPRTLVFDEIDIGIGGRAAEAVGQKLKSLGRGQQVLCVTHLPQIAAFADQHLVVEKREDHGRTKTRIRTLDDRARTHEVARMVSGATVTETSLQHAAQMIARSR
jgi:DNA repair ATPase RecN